MLCCERAGERTRRQRQKKRETCSNSTPSTNDTADLFVFIQLLALICYKLINMAYGARNGVPCWRTARSADMKQKKVFFPVSKRKKNEGVTDRCSSVRCAVQVILSGYILCLENTLVIFLVFCIMVALSVRKSTCCEQEHWCLSTSLDRSTCKEGII